MTNATVPAITGSLPIDDYVPVGIVHGHAETLDPAPLSDIAAFAISGMTQHAAALGADLVIDVTVAPMPHGTVGVRVLATGTAIRFRHNRARLRYQHLLDA